MSKSRGNGIDPLDWVEMFGADALRFTLARGASPGGDLSVGEDHAARPGTSPQTVQRHPVRVMNAPPWRRCRRRSRRRPLDSGTVGRVRAEADSAFDGYEFSRPARRCTTSPGTSSATGTGVGQRCSSPKVSHTTAVLAAVLDTLLKLLHPVMPFRHRNPVEGHRRRIGGRRLAGTPGMAGAGSRFAQRIADQARSWSPRSAASAAIRDWRPAEGARPADRSQRRAGLNARRWSRRWPGWTSPGPTSRQPQVEVRLSGGTVGVEPTPREPSTSRPSGGG